LQVANYAILPRVAQSPWVNDEELFAQIGRLKMELEWLKKKASVFD